MVNVVTMADKFPKAFVMTDRDKTVVYIDPLFLKMHLQLHVSNVIA